MFKIKRLQTENAGLRQTIRVVTKTKSGFNFINLFIINALLQYC
jgi:hypothetical protein